MAERAAERAPVRGRAWSWAALLTAAVLWIGTLPTFGMSIFLAPVSFALTAVAASRATRDAVFWVGVGVNALLALNLLAFLVGLHTGDVSVSWE